MSRDERKKQLELSKALYAFRAEHGLRDLPWRRTHDPYYVAVSELMLQQTQVPRVIEKYKQFIKRFPTAKALSKAPLSAVLEIWSGLGYNRRAKFLHALANTVTKEYKGKFPRTIPELEKLPGIGPYTARAIAAFSYNIPSALIETNIRTVYIHHFFNTRDHIRDTELLPIIEAGIDTKNPRQWYWLLMDYGSFLKANGVRTHRRSKHYSKQSTFKGSRREIRGMIMKELIGGPTSLWQLLRKTGKEKDLLLSVLDDLVREHLIRKEKGKYLL